MIVQEDVKRVVVKAPTRWLVYGMIFLLAYTCLSLFRSTLFFAVLITAAVAFGHDVVSYVSRKVDDWKQSQSDKK